jgi:hypothetical protein
MVRGFKSVVYMEWMGRRKLGMLAVKMRQDRNCEDTEAETDNRDGEQKLMQLNKGY